MQARTNLQVSLYIIISLTILYIATLIGNAYLFIGAHINFLEYMGVFYLTTAPINYAVKRTKKWGSSTPSGT